MATEQERNRAQWRMLLPGVVHGTPPTITPDERGYFLAWTDDDGGGIEEEYRTLGDAVERGDIAQRCRDEYGNWNHRRYEVRERVYGRVVWRAVASRPARR